ncbi:MAG TPA: hypothetical protein VLY45_02230 [Nitrospiria bacterium]|nr:hypothetical protein [Nitrospiria bacterium]
MTATPPTDGSDHPRWLVCVATAFELSQLKRPLQLHRLGKEDTAPVFDGRVGPHRLSVLQTGFGPARAYHVTVNALKRRSCLGVVSVGLSGGLQPDLPSGALVIGDCWTRVGPPGEEGRFDALRTIGPPADRRLRTAALRAAGACGLAVHEGRLATSDCLIGAPEEKRALAARTGALAVDMESGAVAEAALEASVTVVAVRAVLDPVAEALIISPEAFLLPDGSTSVWKSGRAVSGRPSQWPGLWGVGRRGARAMALLARWLCLLWAQEPAAL